MRQSFPGKENETVSHMEQLSFPWNREQDLISLELWGTGPSLTWNREQDATVSHMERRTGVYVLANPLTIDPNSLVWRECDTSK